MAAGPIGACWAGGTWPATTWIAQTWAGRVTPTPPLGGGGTTDPRQQGRALRGVTGTLTYRLTWTLTGRIQSSGMRLSGVLRYAMTCRLSGACTVTDLGTQDDEAILVSGSLGDDLDIGYLLGEDES
jgi:hypothetical protein